jgi:hypothetical protein
MSVCKSSLGLNYEIFVSALHNLAQASARQKN